MKGGVIYYSLGVAAIFLRLVDRLIALDFFRRRPTFHGCL
jgi:hypothetical protein